MILHVEVNHDSVMLKHIIIQRLLADVETDHDLEMWKQIMILRCGNESRF